MVSKSLRRCLGARFLAKPHPKASDIQTAPGGKPAFNVLDPSVKSSGHRDAGVPDKGKKDGDQIKHSLATGMSIICPEFCTRSIPQLNIHGCLTEIFGIMVVINLDQRPRPWFGLPPQPGPSASKNSARKLKFEDTEAAGVQRTTYSSPGQKTMTAINLFFPFQDECPAPVIHSSKHQFGKLEDRENMERERHEHRVSKMSLPPVVRSFGFHPLSLP